MIKFEVGLRVPAPFDRMVAQDECYFDLDANGAPYISLYYFDMTDEEAMALRKTPIETGYFVESQYWMGLIKTGKFIYELTFNPMTQQTIHGHFSPEFFRESQLVMFLGISCPDLTLKALRTATYPPKFLDAMYFTFSNFEPSATYGMIYEVFLSGLRSQPLEILWRDCTKTGNFGDKEIVEG